jgi:UDP-GlcNAc:undecaprenyl-phosphate/decaprenyl-phosphate GlcNAc-1-phosphate transferase
MSAWAAAAIGLVLAGVCALLATPVAIRTAHRTDFYDRPRGYRKHDAPTPFLGGAAVFAAFLIAAIVVGAISTLSNVVLLLCAFAMWAIGTLDDRRAIEPEWRVLAEIAAATALYVAGAGWRLPTGNGADLVLTVFWVVGLVNGFNLMDNLDGACATVGCVSALGLGTLAAIHGEAAHAGMAFALAAACAGFLRFNLARPARIFLGDGGSMTIGFLVAALGMAIIRPVHVGNPAVFALALLAGVVIFDTTLVSVSRRRRGISLLTGGRDHLTHRLLTRVHTPRAVAFTLAITQAILASLAIVGVQLGSLPLEAIGAAMLLLGVVAIAVLDSERWRPPQIAISQPPVQRVRPAVMSRNDAVDSA